MFSAFRRAFQSASRASRTANTSANAASSAVRNARASRFLGENATSQGAAGLPNPQPLDGAPMRGASSRLIAGFTGPSNNSLVPPRDQNAGQPGGRGHATVEPGSISSRVLAEGIGPTNGIFVPPPNSGGSGVDSPAASSQIASSHLAVGFNATPNGLFVPPPTEQGQSNAAESGGATGETPLKGILKKKEIWDNHLNLRWQPTHKGPHKAVSFSDDVKVHRSAPWDNEPPADTTQKTLPSNSEPLSAAKIRAQAEAMVMAINSQPAPTKVNTLINKMGMMNKEGPKLRKAWAQGGSAGAFPATMAAGASAFSPISASTMLRTQLRTALAHPVGTPTDARPPAHGGSSDTATGATARPPSPLVTPRTIFFRREDDGSLTQLSPLAKKRTIFSHRGDNGALTMVH